MLDPLAFMDVGNYTGTTAEQIAQRLINPSPENLAIVDQLKASIQQGLTMAPGGNPAPTTMIDSLNDSLPLGLTPLGISPSGKCGYFRRADGALVQRLNGKMSVM